MNEPLAVSASTTDAASFPRSPAEPRSVIVVASGKGGAGKSIVSILLAKILIRLGYKVLLVEGDQNRGSLHVLLGVQPVGRLEALVDGTVAPSDLVTPVVDRLFLISGDSGAQRLYALGALDRARIHARLQTLYHDFEIVVIDSAPDLEGTVRACSMGATQLLVITVAEPVALSDTYAVMKTVHHQVPYLPIDVLVNRVRSPDEAYNTYSRLSLACRRFLECELGYAGSVPEDDGLRRALGTPGFVLTNLDKSPAISEVQSIVATRLHGWSGGSAVKSEQAR